MKRLLALLLIAGTVHAGQLTYTTAETQTILDQAAQVIGTKLAVTNEIHATSVLEAGLSGVSPGHITHEGHQEAVRIPRCGTQGRLRLREGS